MSHFFKRKKNSIIHPAVISLMLISTALNILLSMFMRATDMPFYIDTVGTIVATALGGTVPGILTAFVTNAVNFFMDGESIFYAPLNMFIAILAAGYFGDFALSKKNRKSKEEPGEKDYGQKTLFDLALFVVVLAVIGGLIGAEITWFLYEEPSDAPLSVSIFEWFREKLGLGVWGCHMLSSFITDLIDKAISVCLALLIIRITPGKVKEYVRLSSWRQKPMSYEEQKRAEKMLRGRISIGTRINIIIIVSTLLITLVGLTFSIVSFRQNTIDSLSAIAIQTAYLASEEITPGMVNVYLQQGEMAPGYMKVQERLKNIKNSSPEIAFLYIYKIEEDGCHVVFDLDAFLSDGRFIPGDYPGKIVSYEEAGLLPHLDKIKAGELVEPERLDDSYGSFYAAYFPVYDDKGNCVCYAISNVEAELVSSMLEMFAGRVILLFLGVLTLVIAVSILTTRYHIVMPILGMTVYANELAEARSGANEERLEKIEELDIRTGDEVELLYRAFCKMTGDIVDQLNENHTRSAATSKMQNVLLMTMADMVESRDSNTGSHVLKTAAYVRIILQGLKRNGYYAEKITDKYMRDVEMSAPLHDVGKISIPEAILNKPGKLTPEEFEIIKTHTTAGKTILENAINSMEGDNDLKEARNMAAYHHERWDGKGYPEGLHGEVIPLSARIMAIADVFDALSSHRVYKQAYTFDESVNIIREGSGTQFDPKCVEVFMESLTEVKKVYKKYQET